jgi:hypothetical protein
MRALRAELTATLRPLIISLLLAIPVGVTWWWWSPRAQVTKARGVTLPVSETSKTLIATDGRFVVLTIAAGVACALYASPLFAKGKPAVGSAITLAVGGVAGAVLSWQFGVLLDHDRTRTAAQVVGHSSFTGPLDVTARGALFVWPIAALTVWVAGVAAARPPSVRAEHGLSQVDGGQRRNHGE